MTTPSILGSHLPAHMAATCFLVHAAASQCVSVCNCPASVGATLICHTISFRIVRIRNLNTLENQTPFDGTPGTCYPTQKCCLSQLNIHLDRKKMPKHMIGWHILEELVCSCRSSLGQQCACNMNLKHEQLRELHT